MTVDDLFRELYPIVEHGVGTFEKRRPFPGRIALRVEDDHGEGWSGSGQIPDSPRFASAGLSPESARPREKSHAATSEANPLPLRGATPGLT